MPRSLEWFRSNGGKIAWVAFFALACHFALTFGHVHFANAGIVSTASVGSVDASTQPGGTPPPSTGRLPRELARDFCAVCSNVTLASTLVLPVSPAAGPPVFATRDLRRPEAVVEPASRDHFHFSARGPPYA